MLTSRSVRGRLTAVAAAFTVLVTLFPAVASAAVTEACPSELPTAGYTDLASLASLASETVDAIDCITFYGVAQGVSSSRFDPHGEVSRWQMALFLSRIADDLGITLPTPSTQGYRDIGTYPVATQNAINQITQLGIAQGVSTGIFDPASPVTRWQMALFLTRLHQRAGFSLGDGRHQGFADIGDLPQSTRLAINQLAQVGLTRGTSTTTFSPHLAVPRWQMGLFLARHLQAGGAEPYVISVVPDRVAASTSDDVLLTITVQTAAGAPVSGRRVDVFVSSVDSQGRCVLDADATLGSGDAGTGTNCRIDSNDPRTSSSGRATVVLRHDSTIELDTIHAWIGASNETFDLDDILGYGTATVQWTAPPTGLVVVSKTVEFGTNTTVQGWLVDSGGDVVVGEGRRIVVRVVRGATQILTSVVQTTTSGVFSFTYQGPSDPDPGNPSAAIVDTVEAFWDRDADGIDDGASELDGSGTITWDDEDPRDDAAVLVQSFVSTLVGESTTVSATVTDKFGKGISGAEVTFTVTGPNGTVATVTTNSSGVASTSYIAVASGTDVIDAEVDIDGGGADILAGDVADLTHYQVMTAPDLSGTRTFDILAVNTSANTVDVLDLGDNSLYRLRWDSTGDTFTVDGAAVTMGSFEAALAELTLPALGNVVELETMPYASAAAAASSFVLTTK